MGQTIGQAPFFFPQAVSALVRTSRHPVTISTRYGPGSTGHPFGTGWRTPPPAPSGQPVPCADAWKEARYAMAKTTGSAAQPALSRGCNKVLITCALPDIAGDCTGPNCAHQTTPCRRPEGSPGLAKALPATKTTLPFVHEFHGQEGRRPEGHAKSLRTVLHATLDDRGGSLRWQTSCWRGRIQTDESYPASVL